MRRVLLFGKLTVLLVLVVACGSAPAPAAVVPPVCPSCHVVASPNSGAQSNELSAVAAVTPGDAWAVGHYFDNNEHQHQLIEHWDGAQWSILSTPQNISGASDLQSVAALTPADVWVLGGSSIEHWNGTQWSIVPNPGAVVYDLLGVAAVATNDIWAVGNAENNGGLNQPLIEHWNGQRWSIVTGAPIGNAVGRVEAISALAANNIWVAGSMKDPQTNYGRGLIEHWDGVQWSVSRAVPYGQQSYLTGIAAVSAADVYAVGYYYDTSPRHTILPLLEHWNGTQWSVLASPALSDSYISQFNAVAAMAANDIWVVGSVVSKADGITRTLLEQWNGRQWNVFSTPGSGSESHLDAIALVPGSSQFWCVGGAGSSPHDQTFIERIG